MSKTENYFIKKIQEAEGEEKKLLNDLFRQIVLSNASFNGKRGSSAKPDLDKYYPDNHTLDGFVYKPAGHPIIDMIVFNTKKNLQNANFQKLKKIVDWRALINDGILTPAKMQKSLEVWLVNNNDEIVNNPDQEVIEKLIVFGTEGARKLKVHLVAERNVTVIKSFKNQLKNWNCKVCTFSFFDYYGDLGINFIEAHHNVPIKEGERETTINDFAAVCSNCHRMLHKGKVLLTVQELKKIIEENKNK